MLLVIGYGSLLRADDGIGQILVETLKPRAGMQKIQCVQLTPELVEPVSRASYVLFIDAQTGDQPGSITCQPVTAQAGGTFTHNVTPQTLLTAANALYRQNPQGMLLSIAGFSFDYADTLSPQLNTLLPILQNHLNTLIEVLLLHLAAETREKTQLS